MSVRTDLLQLAVDAVRNDRQGFLVMLDRYPAPIYVTDETGMVAWYNWACIDFAGRIPSIGNDRWCVSWKLYSADFKPLPHDQSPMAVAVQERQTIRGLQAIAETPGGNFVRFEPLPTPLIDKNGEVVGAGNMLVAITRLPLKSCRAVP